eukprot:9520088-Alexandrium_andersonii.AAC.1
MAEALQVIEPGDKGRRKIGLRGTREENAQSILRGGLGAQYSTGREKRTRVYFAPKVREDL